MALRWAGGRGAGGVRRLVKIVTKKFEDLMGDISV